MKDKVTVTAWVTKYALTSGIMKVQGELLAEGRMLVYRTEGSSYTDTAHGSDFHITEVAAKEKAEDMRDKKIKSIDKQRDKLLKMVF